MKTKKKPVNQNSRCGYDWQPFLYSFYPLTPGNFSFAFDWLFEVQKASDKN